MVKAAFIESPVYIDVYLVSNLNAYSKVTSTRFALVSLNIPCCSLISLAIVASLTRIGLVRSMYNFNEVRKMASWFEIVLKQF